MPRLAAADTPWHLVSVGVYGPSGVGLPQHRGDPSLSDLKQSHHKFVTILQ